jgi:hypothetical protein
VQSFFEASFLFTTLLAFFFDRLNLASGKSPGCGPSVFLLNPFQYLGLPGDFTKKERAKGEQEQP